MDPKAFIFYSVDMGYRHYCKLKDSEDASSNLLPLASAAKLDTKHCWELICHRYTPTLPEFFRFMAACGFEFTLDNWRPCPAGINPELF